MVIWSQNTSPSLTTIGIVGETFTFMRRREHHDATVRVLHAIQASPSITVVSIEPEIETAAWQWLKCHDERAYSFVDATSFEVMRRRRIKDALAFDGNFSSAGYVEVR